MHVAFFVASLFVATTSLASQADPPRDQDGGAAYYQFMLGRWHEGRAHIEEAIAAYRAAADLDPKSAEIQVALCQLCSSQERLTEALEACERATQINPSHPEAHRLLGYMFAALAQTPSGASYADRAIDHLEKAARLAALDSPSGMALARLYVARREFEQAVTILTDVVQSDPDTSNGVVLLAEALFLLSQAERQSGDFADAESAARRLIALDPRGVGGHYALAQVYESKREYRRVLEVLEPAIAAASGGRERRQLPILLMHRGFAHQQLRQYDEAIAAFEEARRAAPDDDLPHVHLVQVHLLAGRLSTALAIAEKGREAHPDSERLRRLEAEALRRNGHVDRAITSLEEHRRTNPRVLEAHLGLAELYMAAKRFEAAIAALDQARSAFPNDFEPVFRLGAALERAGRTAEAEEVFRLVLQKDPRHARALNYLGYLLADRGDRVDQAIQMIQQALEIDPYNGSYLDSLGWAYFKLGKLNLAESHLRRAAEQLPENSVIQDHLAQALFRLDLVDEAIAAWERALQGDGEDIDRFLIERRIQSARERR